MATVQTAPSPLDNTEHETLTLLRQKWRRLNVENEHWMCVIVGEEGSGKSYTALKLGELIDDDFDASNVFFHPAEVLERLRDGDYEAGDVWVMDEAGVGLGNRTWQDSGQVKLNQALQLVRSHNVGFIFTLPRLSELDKQAKGRLQDALLIEYKDEDEGFVQGPWYESNVDRMDFSQGSNDIWWSKPVIQGSEVGSVSFTPPSDEIVDPYEEEKETFQEDFYDETLSELRDEDGEGDEETLTDPIEIANDIRADGRVDEFISEINNGTQEVFEADLVAVEYGVGNTTAKRVKKAILREEDREGVL